MIKIIKWLSCSGVFSVLLFSRVALSGPLPESLSEMAGDLTVEEVAGSSIDEKKVRFNGMVMKRLGKDTYLIQDSTGAVKVVIPLHLLPSGGLRSRDIVSIKGKTDVENGRLTGIRVNHMTFSF